MSFKPYFWISLWLIGLGAIASPVYAANEIIEVKGTVSIKRNNSSQYQPVTVGAQLNLGDLIRPATGSRVKVHCANDTIWSVPAGVDSGLGSGCPESVGAARGLGGRGSDDFLAFLNQSFIAGTQVLETRPLLRWEAVSDTPQYQVQVKTGDRLLWETTVNSTTIQYQGEPLQANQDYQLIITATNAQGMNKITESTFRSLDIEQRNTIQIASDRLKAEDISDEAKALALATLYQSTAQPNTDPPANRGLLLEAILPLEAIATQGSQTPHVHRLLGDLYLQLGWFGLAEQRYQKTIELAHLEQDRQEWAIAQVGLASITANRGDLGAAKRWLWGAEVGYKLLNDIGQIEAIEQWISKLDLLTSLEQSQLKRNPTLPIVSLQRSIRVTL